MIVIDHGPYKWRAACIDVLPSSSLPSSAAHLPVFPHKEQTRPKKKFMSAFRPSPSRWKKKGKVQVPGGRPSSISDSGENLNGCDEIHLPAHHYFLLPATEGKKRLFFHLFGSADSKRLSTSTGEFCFSFAAPEKGEAANEEMQTESTIHGLVVDAESETEPSGKSSRRTSRA